jgi:hypothetical protein
MTDLEVIDACPADGRPHWDHPPLRATSHLTLTYNGVYVDLVSGHCPACDQVLVNLKLLDEDDPYNDEDRWTSVATIVRGTRRVRQPS